MGYDQNKKYHIANDGSIHKVNEDGSFTTIGNIAELRNYNPNKIKIKKWILSNYNWLYCISLFLLLVSSGIALFDYNNYYYGELIILSVCAGSTSIIVPWIFRLSSLVKSLLLLLLIASFLTIMTLSPHWCQSFQIAIGFWSIFVYCVRWAKLKNQIK